MCIYLYYSPIKQSSCIVNKSFRIGDEHISFVLGLLTVVTSETLQCQRLHQLNAYTLYMRKNIEY